MLHDDLIGARLKPNTQTHYSKLTVRVNSQGFRDDEPRPDSPYVVVFLGDCQTFGDGVQAEEAFPQRVGKLTGIRTLNAGCPGWNLEQCLLFLKKDTLQPRPKKVILGLYTGRLWNLTVPRNKKFLVDDGKTLLKYSSKILSKQRQGSLLRTLHSYLSFNSYLYSYLKDCWKKESEQFKILSHKILGTKIKLPPAAQVYLKSPKFSRTFNKTYQAMTLSSLKEMKSFCQNNGIALEVVLIPTFIETSNTLPEQWLSAYSLNNKEIDLTLPNKLVEKICEQNQIRFLNLLPVFQSTAGGGRNLYLLDGHLSAAGHALIAEAVSKELLGTSYPNTARSAENSPE